MKPAVIRDKQHYVCSENSLYPRNGYSYERKIWQAYSGRQPKHMEVIIFFQKEGVALSRDSQHFSVPPNISGTGKAMNEEVVNKTAKIKCKKLTSLQHGVIVTNSHIQNGKTHFTRPS